MMLARVPKDPGAVTEGRKEEEWEEEGKEMMREGRKRWAQMEDGDEQEG